jgi:hypothetical protein
MSSTEGDQRLMGDRVRYAQQITAFPAGITTGSTWDTSLMYARGNAMGTCSILKT